MTQCFWMQCRRPIPDGQGFFDSHNQQVCCEECAARSNERMPLRCTKVKKDGPEYRSITVTMLADIEGYCESNLYADVSPTLNAFRRLIEGYKALLGRHKEVMAFIKATEWTNTGSSDGAPHIQCVACSGYRPNHKPGCRAKQLLDEAEKL